MIPFYVLVAITAILYGAGLAGIPYFEQWQHALTGGLTAMFLITASAHWGKKREDLIRMVPPAFSNPGLLVTITGILEIAGVIGLWIPVLAPYAGTGLALMLLAMFPANIHAAKAKGMIGGRKATPLPQRTVLQLVFIAAVLLAGWL